MTPKEKAQDLIHAFTFEIGNYNAKRCALILVDEIILEREVMYASVGINPGKFWHEVKEELNKM